MVREDPQKVNKQLKKDEDQYYGDATISGSSPDPESDDNADDAMEDVTGEPQGDEPLNIAKHIEEDEEAEAMKPVDDYITPDDDDDSDSSGDSTETEEDD